MTSDWKSVCRWFRMLIFGERHLEYVIKEVG
jgi:hypothetical protein